MRDDLFAPMSVRNANYNAQIARPRVIWASDERLLFMVHAIFALNHIRVLIYLN